MGFLDNTTNSLILDAVLTDTGRQFISRNDGSFSIVKFALGDDEVNYNIIRKYGRSVGREKIEKNTCVFEALTNPSQAMKYKLVSVSNPNLLRLPSFSLSGDSAVDSSSSTISLGRVTQKTAFVTIEQTINNETSIDVELRDQVFIVELSSLFLQIPRQVPSMIDMHNRATYLLTRSANENSYGGSILQFTLGVKSLTDAMFTVYGTVSNKNIINTYAKVTGTQSGAVKEFRVSINKAL